MTDEGLILRRNITDLENLLAGDLHLPFLEGEKRRGLLMTVRDVRGKLESLGDNILTVGLMGGTGVGKSTVMNALAHENIASTSHRRPHTNEILVYRHSAVPPPELAGRASLPWREYLHEAEEVRQVVLCDLPDYDSIEETHRETVLALLDALDMLIWVISPEKYADGQFYDFLQLLPKDRSNCYFVLNKTDLFFGGAAPASHEQLAAVLGSLTHHLTHAGISEPVVYHVSATEALTGEGLSAWNQFSLLRRELFRTRDIKEIRRIKAANIQAELEPVFRALELERQNLEAMNTMLQAGSTMTGEELKKLLEDVDAGAVPWIEAFLKHSLADRLAAGRDLVGPGRIIAALAGRLKGAGGNPEKAASLRSQAVAHIAEILERHLAVREERLKADFYRRFNRSELPGELAPLFNGGTGRAVFEGNLAGLFTETAGGGARTFGGLYTLWQRIVYAVPLLMFLLVLPGEEAWKSFFDNPGFFAGLRTAAFMAVSLFTSRGLAAMASLILVSLFLGWHFYRRSDRMIALRAQGVAGIMRDELKRLVQEAVVTQGTDVDRLRGSVRSSLSAMGEVLKGQRHSPRPGH